jgi:hypothetical protein
MALTAYYRPWGMPADTPENLGQAWLHCVCTAFGDEEIEERFLATLPAEAEGANRKSVGADEESVRRFIDWVNAYIWDQRAAQVRRTVSAIP